MTLRVVQVGANKGNDELYNYIQENYDQLEFGLFVEANSLHIDDLAECYKNYQNIIIENIAIKVPSQNQDILTIYYHTNEHPHYGISSCNIEHLKKHMEWCPHLQGGEVKSFDVSCITLDDLFEKYSITELDILFLDIEGIDAEVLLTFDWKKYSIKRVEFEHLHLGEYGDAIKNMMIGMGYKQTTSLHEYNWAFEKKQCISEKEKLKNFPPINFISVEETEDRRNLLCEKFEQHGLTNYTAHIFKKYRDEDHVFNEASVASLIGPGRGPTTSHLKAIKNWYFDTDEEYAFFCEDDLSFESVKYWNFTWQEFFNSLPSDWGCVQLCWVRENMFAFSHNGITLRPRCWCDWSACAYLITRSHAKKLISNYYRDGTFNLFYVGNDVHLRPDWALRPASETIIFSTVTPIYSFPLFLEDVSNCKTTWDTDIGRGYNYYSHDVILEWWKTQSKNLSLNDLIPKY